MNLILTQIISVWKLQKIILVFDKEFFEEFLIVWLSQSTNKDI